MSLSDTGRIVLTRAAAHDDRLASFHKKLPAGARNKVIDSLLNQGLLEETRGTYRSAPLTEQGDGMLLTTLRITDAGFRAIDLEPPTMTEGDIGHELDLRQEQVNAENAADVAAMAPQTASAVTVAMDIAVTAEALHAVPVAPTQGIPARTTLRQAAAAVLAAWDDEASRETDMIAALEGPVGILRALLTERAPRAAHADAQRAPRTSTKQETVLTMLRRDEGASGPQIAEATGWASHTVRGFLAGLKKKGFTIVTLERVRLVGPNKEGAKGSYTIYRIEEAA